MANCPKCNAAVDDDAQFCPDCGEALKDRAGFTDSSMLTIGGLDTFDDADLSNNRNNHSPALEPGTVFADRYVIEDIVGRGGMGVVYRAKDKLSDKTVALKLIRPERLAGTNAVKKLIAEGITARDIRHPNIVAVYDVGEANGQPFVSMEYLGGQSLRAWHRSKVQNREDVSTPVAARIISEILDGLRAAHAAGVIHRDLKPENVVLAGKPSDTEAPLKILDFGIARATGGALESGTGTGLGTPRYMAPEQITNADSAGPAADLYSVSVMFYELLVDVLPQGHWQPPSGGRSDVPAGIDALIEKGLSNRPANRPSSADSYLKTLESALAQDDSPNHLDRLEAITGNIPTKKILKWSGITFAVLIGLGIIDSLISDTTDPCEGLSGQAYAQCAGEKWDDGGGNSPPPPPPPPPYQSLNGQWLHELGANYSIRVSRNGSISGSGVSSDGYNVQISGRFSGNSGTYSMTAPALGLTLNGKMQWDRECHVDYTTYDPYTQAAIDQGRFHINHQPGAPCPS